MKRDIHDQARELIALGGEETLSHAQQRWLRAHLEACAPCRDYEGAAHGLVRSLRSLPLAADSRLVQATQMRVRFHAARLQEIRERMWLVGLACFGVGLSAALTAPFLWRLFAWLGKQAAMPSLMWQAAFLSFCIAPALVVSALLLIRGAHMTNSDERVRQWR
jgi:hypothetical protein